MRIKKLTVDGLFGIFHHEIGMKLDDRITIIHGPNGYGKTTILRMVNSLFTRRYSDLRQTPFTEFRVELEDGSEISVTKATTDAPKPKERKTRGLVLTIKLLHRGKEIERGEITSPALEEWETHSHFPIAAFEQIVPGLVRESRATWRYLPSNEELDLEDVIDRFGEQIPPGMGRRQEKRNEFEWLNEIQQSVRVRFIESQRLLKVSRAGRRSRESYSSEPMPALELSVAVHADDLAKAIQGKLAEYAALSQSLDRTFPVRLVEAIQSKNVLGMHNRYIVGNLRQKLAELEDKRNRLQEAGLLDKQEDVRFQVPEDLQDTTQQVLPVYVDDVERKLSVFDGIAAKIDLLKNIVNSRFSFKQMSINKEKGFIFRTNDGHPLTPANLSSGEQHMLVLFSELLFRVEPNSLIMIDEPEISLHVTWQQQFLRDLQGVTELASFDALIATHSPQIVHDRWDDLTVELEGAAEQNV